MMGREKVIKWYTTLLFSRRGFVSHEPRHETLK